MRKALCKWLVAIVRHGAIKNDLIVMSRVLRATNSGQLYDLAELSAALQPSAERAKEALRTRRQSRYVCHHDLDIMQHDATAQRGDRPFTFASLKHGDGVRQVVSYISEAGGLAH